MFAEYTLYWIYNKIFALSLSVFFFIYPLNSHLLLLICIHIHILFSILYFWRIYHWTKIILRTAKQYNAIYFILTSWIIKIIFFTSPITASQKIALKLMCDFSWRILVLMTILKFLFVCFVLFSYKFKKDGIAKKYALQCLHDSPLSYVKKIKKIEFPL